MIKKKYPMLFQFFSCYFHQDWVEEFGSSDSAVDCFIDSEKLEFVLAAKNELLVIADLGYSDIEIMNLLSDLGCYYDPRNDYSSVLAWIEYVIGRI